MSLTDSQIDKVCSGISDSFYEYEITEANCIADRSYRLNGIDSIDKAQELINREPVLPE